jgi:hypothetical protein
MSKSTMRNRPTGVDNNTTQTPVILVRPSRGQLLLLSACMLVPWLLFGLGYAAVKWQSKYPAVSVPIAARSKADRHFTGNPGPWGKLEFTRIAIEPPSEFIDIEQPEFEVGPPRWTFKGFTQDQARTFCRDAGMTLPQLAALQHARWEIQPDGCAVLPDTELILSLNANTRGKLYDLLARFAENTPQTHPYALRPEFLAERLEGSGLSTQTLGLFKSLLYTRGQLLLFADSDRVVPKLSDPAEKIRFLKMAARRVTYLIHLQIEKDSNIDELVHYWAVGGRTKDLRPLFESMMRVPGGCEIDIVHLLPQFARRRLYTYPALLNDNSQTVLDCHWTTVNFFAHLPDDQLQKASSLHGIITRDYYQITKPGQLGDVILLNNTEGEVIHSAIFVADDVVFTKNGAIAKQPWILMTISNMLDLYAARYSPDRPLRMVVLRNKNL